MLSWMQKMKEGNDSLPSEKENNIKYIISKIDWDIEDEERDDNNLPITAKDLGLPTFDETFEIDTDDMGWDLEDPNDQDEVSDVVSDWLSDEYGYCHFGFSIKKA